MQEHSAELESLAHFTGIVNDRLHALVHDSGYFGATGLTSYDGATELFDRKDPELGQAGLLQLAQTQVRIGSLTRFHLDQLEEQLLCFTNEVHLPDDLTLVKLSRAT